MQPSCMPANIRYICLSLFLLKEKVTKKFKDKQTAPRVCPAIATRASKEWFVFI